MTRKLTDLLKLIALVVMGCGSVWTVRGESRTFSMPGYLANPGGVLQVPLMLDNAAGLAAIKVQINFDAKVLDLQTVTAGALGQSFEMNRGDGDGFVQLTFFRGDALPAGTGQLAVLKFHANPGAVTDMYSELAIADVVLSDSTGVIDMLQKDTITVASGQVTVSPSSSIDNANNGLPDWWEEQHGMSPFVNNRMQDLEKDGLPNLLEYAFGGNPNVADAQTRGVQMGRHEENGVSFLRMAFRRRLGDSALIYRVQESTNLSQWNTLNLNARIIGAPQDMGDGTEKVEVMGTLPMNGVDAQPKGFLRVEVDR